jgi:transposase-like protein
MNILNKQIQIPDSAIEQLIKLTDAAEMAHNSTVSRHDLIDKLLSIDREQVNCMNEKFREWRDELKQTTHDTTGNERTASWPQPGE